TGGGHTHGTIAGADIKYSFIGNPDRCPSACEAQATGPNGNAGADGMASIISHELEEATTDPDLNAWYDRRGQENADKCAWTFGTTYTANGEQARQTLSRKRGVAWRRGPQRRCKCPRGVADRRLRVTHRRAGSEPDSARRLDGRIATHARSGRRDQPHGRA